MPNIKDVTSTNASTSTPATTEERKAVLEKYLVEVDDQLEVLYEKREWSYGHRRQLIGYEVRHWEGERKEAVLKLERMKTDKEGDEAKRWERED